MSDKQVPSILAMSRVGRETRIAVVHDGVVTDLMIEREGNEGVAGNIYLGRVERILPGLQAAFVDIGLSRSAFLYAGDAYVPSDDSDDPPDAEEPRLDDDDVEEISEQENDLGAQGQDGSSQPSPHRKAVIPPIGSLVHVGEVLLVQVAKEPLKTKGARLTLHASFPGRYLVMLPGHPVVRMTRRIAEEEERERLRTIVSGLIVQENGYIVRTAANGVPEDELASEARRLQQRWVKVVEKSEEMASQAPCLVWKEVDPGRRAVRDFLRGHTKRVVVDDPELFDVVQDSVEQLNEASAQVELHDGPRPLFESLEIEDDLLRIFERRVWLPSGGFLIIEHTEALTSIDVNTGKYVGGKDLEETVTSVNIEAAREVGRQLRLRDIGGIIVVDFIDMRVEQHRVQVLEALQTALLDDPARTTVLPVSDFGLIQMTRKRTRAGLAQRQTQVCTHCQGAGAVASEATVAFRVLRKVMKHVRNAKQVGGIEVRIPSVIVSFLQEDELESVRWVERRVGAPLTLVADPQMKWNESKIRINR